MAGQAAGGELAGRHVVITGGTGGLGRGVVRRLAAAGAICHLPVRHTPEAGFAAAVAPGGDLRLTPGVDLTDEPAVAAFYDGLPALWASVHLAGGFEMAPIAETSADDLRAMFEKNTVTAFACARAAMRQMRHGAGGGRIVNVAARPALELRKGAHRIAYSVSKAAVASLTAALAEELKAEHILVNAIAPSTIDTPSNRAARPDADFGKWLTPEAAAETILHLVSPLNRELTGAVLPLFARA